ncbi:MAG: asparagine synthase-related protein [Woeseiaceae bacterium]
MPGLFGFIAIEDPSSIDPVFAESLFSRMEERLHHPSQHVERWMDRGAGIYIGRVGPSHFNSEPWAGSAEADGRIALSFISGAVHSKSESGSPAAAMHARLVLESGVATFEQLRGFYCAAIHSRSASFTAIAADRRASIPLYYAELGGMLLFAPELKALLSHPELPRDLDLGAVASFLGSGHPLGPQSLLKSIRRLQGGEALVVRRGQLERRTYWKFSPGCRPVEGSDEELEEELGRLVRAAVSRNLGDPNRTVIFLSGGADSRGILAGALDAVENRGERLSTVCWGAHRGSDKSDASIAERIAGAYDLNHRFVTRKIDNYVSDFRATNYLLDGQSDMAALHPHEHRLMLELRDAGFNRALRGDQVFGGGGGRHVEIYEPSHALAEAGLRRLRDLAAVANYVNPSTFKALLEASDDAMDSALDSVGHLAPNDGKDYLYFVHRVQGYLNSGAYLKQVVFDTRNVFLDEDILSFLEQVPVRLRINKLLYRRAMRRRYPDLWTIPVATENTLENWDWQLGNDTALRRFVREQLDDSESEIWQYFDRLALRSLLDSLLGYTMPPKASKGFSGRALVRKALLSITPKLASAMLVGRESRYHPANRALLRVMSLKDWYDTQISGD